MLLTDKLLPFPDLELATVRVDEAAVQVELTATAATAPCPLCQQPTSQIHSHYPRAVADLPWATFQVHFAITARKFVCPNPTCPRQVFVERLGPAIPLYARRTHRLTTVLQDLALTAGGQNGARLAHAQRLPASPSTLLRLAHATPLPAPEPPRAIGIDDWAWRKGHRYGTLIVDLERHRPIALLADRDAASVAAWLQEHPEVEVIARDRSPLYAAGAPAGAPQAVQVADRWHVVKNLVEALEKLFLRKRSVLQPADMAPARAVPRPEPAPAGADAPDSAPPGPAESLRPLPATAPLPLHAAAEAASVARHEQIVELHARIHALAAQPLDIAAIARHVGVSRVTVYRYLRMVDPPPRVRRTRAQFQQLIPHQEYLVRRWNEGSRNARQLWREIGAQGYRGAERTVQHFVGRLRQDSGAARKFKTAGAARIYEAGSARPHPWTAVQAARLLVSAEPERSAEQRQYLAHLEQADAEVASASTLTQQFMALVRQRRGAELEAWLQAAEQGPVAELRALARSIRTDYAAVQAGLTLEWSNGPTESQVGRLKMLKRQMNGRAGFALLRQRVLYRAPALPRQSRKGTPVSKLAA